jgi:carbon monoxide dehydrogenase subunit G
MIEVNEQVEVAAPPRNVWNLLSDPHAVAECVPGAKLGERHEDGSFDAALSVKFGPAKVNFRARVAMDLDAATMMGQVTTKGKDDQGGTRMRGTMTFKVLERAEPPGSIVPIDAQVEVSGRLAMLVESGAKLVVKRMTSEFSERLAARFAEGSEARAAVAGNNLKGE